MNGYDELARHLPEITTSGGRARLIAIFLAAFLLSSVYFIVSDQIPTWTIDSEILVTAIGLVIFSGMIRRRKQFAEKFGADAFRQAMARFGLPGIGVIAAVIVHVAYMNGPKWPPGRITLAMTIVGCYWILVGIMLWLRAVAQFGIDNLTMLYVYFPAESRASNAGIYAILRHPIYAAGLRIGLGLALVNQSIYALSYMPFLLLAFTAWVRLVEEPELIERFPNYLEYRRRVPKFWPRLADFSKFISFLVSGG